MNKLFIGVIALTLIGVGAYFYTKTAPPKPPTETPLVTSTTTATFTCADNKTIAATFTDKAVQLVLSDGRTLELPQAISASGARYANADESIVFWNKGDTATLDEAGNTTFAECVTGGSAQTGTQIANPASENCTKVGGTLTIEKRGDGGEYGLCTFTDGMACEEWALMRGECPVGGVKTTGYTTIDQKYCAWSGGSTTAVPQSVCTFKTSTQCSTADFYNGKCDTK